MRKFGYITLGEILDELNDAMKARNVKISRSTLYKLEKKGLFASGRTIGRWRRYSPEEAEIIIRLVKENYGLIEAV